PAFEHCSDALPALHPAYYRIVVDWPELQPSADKAPVLDGLQTGCLRDVKPCAAYAGVSDQRKALAARQKAEGGWVGVVVFTGTPAWAASAAHGCERSGTQPVSRPPS